MVSFRNIVCHAWGIVRPKMLIKYKVLGFNDFRDTVKDTQFFLGDLDTPPFKNTIHQSLQLTLSILTYYTTN